MIHVSDINSFLLGRREDDDAVKLIDNIFLEFTNVEALPFNQASFVRTVLSTQVGDYDKATVEVGVNAVCAEGFNGSDCSTFCQNDINGDLVCEQGTCSYGSYSRECLMK